MKNKLEVPGTQILMDSNLIFPMLDVDEKIKLSLLKFKMRDVIKQHHLGQYILVETRKGYKVAFTHDSGRSKNEVDEIIKSFVDIGLCDPNFYSIGLSQHFRGWRISGKYIEKDLKLIGTFKTKYIGKPSTISPMLDVMFQRLYQ